jgi:hypothetical protein
MPHEISDRDFASFIERCGHGDRVGQDEILAILPCLLGNPNLDLPSAVAGFGVGVAVARNLSRHSVRTIAMAAPLLTTFMNNQNASQMGGGTTTNPMNPMMSIIPFLLPFILGKEDHVEVEEKFKWYEKARGPEKDL